MSDKMRMEVMRPKAEYNIYGQGIGILMCESQFPRIPGAIGNFCTFDFPVTHKVVKGATVHRVVLKADQSLIKPYIDAARELEKEGVKAITTSCGFLAMFQEELANAVEVPVFASSLLQVPMVYRMLKRGQKVGIITADSRSLGKRQFESVGIDSSVEVEIVGMENQSEFWEVFFEDKAEMDVEKMEREVVGRAKELAKDPSVKAIVLECSTVPPFASSVQEATHLPVFDFVTLTNLVYNAVVRGRFFGFM